MLDRNEQGQEILRTLMMSAQDVANEWFESPELRIALGRFVSEGMVDPSRAPSGKHTLYLYHYEPYNIREGVAKWDELRQETADGILKFLQTRTTNMGPENILGRGLHSPLDCERVNKSFVKADQGHIGPDLHQVMGNRPFPGMSNYRTPVRNLYLCGCRTSPGGGVNCGSRAAVPVIMEDLGMNFNDLIA